MKALRALCVAGLAVVVSQSIVSCSDDDAGDDVSFGGSAGAAGSSAGSGATGGVIGTAGGSGGTAGSPEECGPGKESCAGECVTLANDPDNCGSCGKACAADEVCSAGECRLDCVGGTTACDRSCVDTLRDRYNCGECGHTCDAGYVCSNGTCALSCQAGLVNCDGVCIDPDSSREYCGATEGCGESGGTAGTACGAGEICDGGQCVISCPGSLIVCDDTCVNPNTDRNHCGATEGCGDGGGTAGQVCDWDQICLDGVCTKSCPAGLVGCGGDCIDPDTSDDYCGASGNCQGANAGVACQADEYCSEGACLHENCRRHGGAIWCGYDGLAANKSCGEICQRAGMTISHDASVVQGINESLECEALAAAFGVPKLDEVSVEPFTHTCALVSGAVIYCSTDPNCVSKLDETPGSGVAQFICPCEQP